MTCNRFRTLIQQRFDQDLTTQDHRALINHMEGCESCAKFDHQLDQMIQAAQDTPAPDEVRPQNPEALARLIMEQLPQKKGSLINMIMSVFGGIGGGKPRAPKAAKAGPATKGGSSAIREKSSKLKSKGKVGEKDSEPDRRPGGVTFGRKKDEHLDNAAIESQVGTFSRLKSMSNRTPEQLDREAQSTTRSLGEKFGMPGANTILDEGPLTLAESIKRKVSESQKLSPLEDDPDPSGSLQPMHDNTGASHFGRPDNADGGSNWGPPSFAAGGRPGQVGAPAGDPDKVDWGGGAHAAKSGTGGGAMPGFAASTTPVGFDEHPGSSIGLAAPGSKRPMAIEPSAESSRAGIGLAPAPSPADWGNPNAANTPSPSPSTAGGGAGWGATDNAKSGADASSNWGGAPAPATANTSANVNAPTTPAASPSGWTSGWGGEAGQPSVPLKSSDSQAISAPQAIQATPAPQAADPWAPVGGAWGGGQAAADAAQAASPQPSASHDAWGAVANASGSAPTADPWGAPVAPNPSQEMAAPVASHTSPATPTDTPALDPWGSAPSASADNFAPAPVQAPAWGAPAATPPAAPAQADAWGASAAAPSVASPAAPAQADAWGASAAAPSAFAPAAPAQADAWGASAAAPSVASPAAPAQADAWGASAAAPSAFAPAAPVQADAWGAPAAAPAAPTINNNNDRDVQAIPSVPSASAPAAPDAWGAASAQPAWGAPAAMSSSPTGDSPVSDQWGAAPAAIPGPEPSNGMATGYATIPPGQFATPQNAGTAIASSGWGQAPVPPEPLDAAQIEAKKNTWKAEAEQLETGTWKAFAPKMNEGLGGRPAPMPVAEQAPAPATTANAAGERWDVPIQERAKTQGEQLAPAMANFAQAQAPMPAVSPSPIAPMQPAAAASAQVRWDVPIQERAKLESEQGPTPPVVSAPAMGMGTAMGMPPGSVGSPVMSSGIPVNQIVEKMGQVLGGQSQAASAEAQESRWDVPIQERAKGGEHSQEIQALPPVPVQPASNWGQPAFEAAPAAVAAAGPAPAVAAPDSESAAWGSNTSSWGQDQASVPIAAGWSAQPAAAPNNGGWGAGDSISQPVAQPTSSWGQQAPNSWGEPAAQAAVSQANPIVSQNQAPVSSAAWGSDTAGGGWGQSAAPMANSWANAQPQGASPAQAPAPPSPPQPPAIKPEVTDRVQGGGLLSGIDDKAIDRIFGEIGVQESVSKTLVNSGADPVSNFSPPQTTAPQSMAAPVPSPVPAFAQASAPEAPKGLLGGIDDNAIDRIFSQNLGVSEPSIPVGNGADMAAPVTVAAGAMANTWSQPQPSPAPLAPSDPAQNPGWGAPPAASTWGQLPALPPSPANAPAANTGWGMAAAAPSQWGQPAAAPQSNPLAAAQPIAENGPPKLFSVDDSVMDRIFSENLGIPQDGQPAANSSNVAPPAHVAPPEAQVAAPVFRQTPPEMEAPAAPFQGGPPPKIEGIGRLDASADPNQDAGSGRIASIGKFLLDQKDLDKIGKLTNADNNPGKLRILTKENSDDLQSLLGQIGAQKGVIGSVIVGHDGLLIANTMPVDMDAESVGVWALGVYMNTEHVTKKMGHDRVHQVVSRTPRGYVIIADFGGGLLVCVTEGKDTDSLIPLMRTITQLVN